MAIKPSVPKGTRDFSPAEVQRRHYLMDAIKAEFRLYGFRPIETPTFENSEFLKGKYGEEGDRLIFNILNNGEYLKKVPAEVLTAKNEAEITPRISKRAMRYDLTVPFARYVVQHQNDITLPFKRYQIQPVWRADRPQHGRYQEFYQCDADVVGSDSLYQEVDLVKIFAGAFNRLKLDGCTIKLNNRKILSGIASLIGAENKLIDFTVALDKLDKIGRERVEQEMIDRGISADRLPELEPFFTLSGSFEEKLNTLRPLMEGNAQGIQGLNELEFIYQRLNTDNLKSTKIDLDITLARGLNYYTGTILEVAAPDGVKIGSIGGGGRYDDLTGIFGLKDVSGVGISFGLDRIYLVMEELGLFPEEVSQGVELLMINFGPHEADHAMGLLDRFRESGIPSELYPDNTKMGKQMAYADKNSIPYVLLVGENEIAAEKYALKDMRTGDQTSLSMEDVVKRITSK